MATALDQPAELLRTDELACAVLFGDIVASKQYPDRPLLQRHISAARKLVNETMPSIRPVLAVQGDGLLALFATVAQAARASLVLRLALLSAEPSVDCRFGIGFGDIMMFEGEHAGVCDGPAFWAAREAINQVHGRMQTPDQRYLRTGFLVPAAGDPIYGNGQRLARAPVTDRDCAWLDAALITRDALIAGMDTSQHRQLLDLLLGGTSKMPADAMVCAVLEAQVRLDLAGA